MTGGDQWTRHDAAGSVQWCTLLGQPALRERGLRRCSGPLSAQEVEQYREPVDCGVRSRRLSTRHIGVAHAVLAACPRLKVRRSGA